MGTVSTQKVGLNEGDIMGAGANQSYKDQDKNGHRLDGGEVREKAGKLIHELDGAMSAIKQNWLPIMLSGVGLLALGGGLTGFLTYRARQNKRFIKRMLKLF